MINGKARANGPELRRYSQHAAALQHPFGRLLPEGEMVQHSGGQLSSQKDPFASFAANSSDKANAAPVPISVNTPNNIIRFFIVIKFDNVKDAPL